MKMMGISCSVPAMPFWSSRPLAPGSRTSSTRHAGEAGRLLLRKSWVEAKAATLKPTERSRFSSERRIAASSSTTNTTASLVVMTTSPDRPAGQTGMLPPAIVGRRPDPPAVGLDDRAADRESHAEALRLGRIEGVEQMVDALRVQSRPRVARGDEHALRSIQTRANHELSWGVTGAAHSFDRVDDQVEKNLLQLDSVGQDER